MNYICKSCIPLLSGLLWRLYLLPIRNEIEVYKQNCMFFKDMDLFLLFKIDKKSHLMSDKWKRNGLNKTNSYHYMNTYRREDIKAI